MAPIRAFAAFALAGYGAVEGTSTRPPCRKSPEFHSLTWPDGTDRVVAFGGKGFTWEHRRHRHNAVKKVQMFGDTWGFDGDDDKWTELGGKHGESPISRWKPSSCTVDDGKALVLFGGDHITDISGVMQDLWIFRTAHGPGLGHWSKVKTENVPRARRGHILEASSTHLLIMGGKTYEPGTNGLVLTDVWTIPLAALDHNSERLSWKRGADFPGSPRWGATGTVMKSAEGDDVMAVFGGRHLNANAGFHSTASGAYTYFNELWLYSFKDDSWTQPELSGDKPCPRDHHGASDLNGDLWVFGGRVSEERAESSVLNDIWSFSLKTMSWTMHKPVGGVAPAARFMPGVAGTSYRGKPAVAVFAGETLPGSTKQTSRNDVWYYVPSSADEGEWTLAMAADCSAESVAPEAVMLAESEAESSLQYAAPLLLFVATFTVGVALAKKAQAGGEDATCENTDNYYVSVE